MSVAFPKLSDHKIGQNFKDSLAVPIEHPNKRIYQKNSTGQISRFCRIGKIYDAA